MKPSAHDGKTEPPPSPRQRTRQSVRHASSNTIAPLLLLIFVPATSLAYLVLSSSYSIGVMLSCVTVVAWAVMRFKQHGQQQQRAAPYVLGVLAVVLIHLLIASALGPIDWLRGLGSVLMLAIFMIGSVALAQCLKAASDEQIRAGAQRCLIVLGVITAFGILDWLQPNTELWSKSLFPFSEPSHLALFLAPILLFNCVIAKPAARFFYLALALLATTMLQNVTLAAVCILIAFLCLRLRHVLLLIALVIPAALTLDIEYYLVRLDFSGASENLSNLVYFQGWQLMFESWERSNGWGIGFQQLGVFGTDTEAAELIRVIMDDYLNLLDGGFTLSKIVSEFGIFGLLLVGFFMRSAWSAARLLRDMATKTIQVPVVQLFAASCICAYAVELFLRGVGYFSPTGLLLFASVLIRFQYKIPVALKNKRATAKWRTGSSSGNRPGSQPL